MFIAVVVSNIKIGNLTQTVPLDLGSDAPGEEIVVDNASMSYAGTPLVNGTESPEQPLNRKEERALVRESTASFPGRWPQVV